MPRDGILSAAMRLPSSETSGLRAFVAVIAATTLAYVALAFSPDRTHRLAREAAAWACLLVLTGLYVAGTVALERAKPLRLPALLLCALPLAIAAICVWPFHSADLFLYANAGHLEARHGLDPYVAVPSDVPGWREDPMFTDLWKDQPFPYGFLFAHVAHLAAALGGESLSRTVLLMKALNAVVLLATGALVFSTSARLDRRRPDVAAWLVLGSPFLLVHHVANGHNDLLLGFFVVLGLRLALDGRPEAAVAAVVAGTLVKVAAAATLPFLVVFAARRHGVGRAALALLVGLCVAAALSWPYLVDADRFRWTGIADALTSPAYSLHAALLHAVRFVAGRDVPAVRVVTQAALAIAFVGFLAVRTTRAARAPEPRGERLLSDSVAALIALVCVASSRFGPWYGAMFLPAALLLPEGSRLRRLALLLCAFELAGITFVGRARILDALVMTALPFAIEAWLGRRRSAPPARVEFASDP